MHQKKNVRNDVDEEFYNTLSSVGKELFADFLGENSRTRQMYTLVSAVVAILFAFALIDPSTTTIDGTFITFADLSIPKKLAGAICAYFTVVYLISVLKDYQVYRYKSLSAIGIMGKTRDSILQTFGSNRRSSKIKLSLNTINPPTSKKSVPASRIQRMYSKEKDTVIRKYSLKIQPLQKELLLLKNSPIQTPEADSRIKAITKSMNQLSAKGDKEIFEITRNISPLIEHEKNSKSEKNENPIDDTKNRLGTLQKTQNSYKMFNWVIFFVEVVFPVALGAYAIWAVFFMLPQ